jgi:tRNA/tmRNA/rRNA uracil-C5-methylase (TrmA/RlmC/RlmD family)
VSAPRRGRRGVAGTPGQQGGSAAGTVVRLRIGAVAHGGHCVARHEGRVVFVRHTLPGELVDVRLTEARERDRFWRGDAVAAVEPAPGRVEPRCPVARPGGCGGCDWQHASLEVQRSMKAAVVTEQLHRLGRLEAADLPPVVVEAVPGDAGGLGWRTRVQFAVDGTGRAGLRRHRSHDVVDLQGCPIADPAIDALGVPTRRWPGVSGVDVVAAHAGGEVDRLVVVEPVAGPDGDTVRVPALAATASLAVRNGGAVERVRGRGWVREQVLVDGEPRPFRVSGAGFWQVHPGAAQVLLDAVLEAAAPREGERALDLYCGVGLFAAGLAGRVGPAGSVLGVEGDARAVADARRNLHDLPWVRLEQGSVEQVLTGPATATAADVVVLDPPRTGAGREVIEAVLRLRPRVVVYVACDPAALARDVATARDEGYRLSALRAFDLFPMTHHVECVASFVPAVLEEAPGYPAPAGRAV